MTKIQVRKQFTTLLTSDLARRRCFQYDEDTSSKAIHNLTRQLSLWIDVVFNMTKIQVRKQFTTPCLYFKTQLRCFQYDEDTSSKAIHNVTDQRLSAPTLFSIWRRYKFESNSQPNSSVVALNWRCFQYDEDTSSKAIHNALPLL